MNPTDQSSTPHGLSSQEVEARRLTYGPNRLEHEKPKSAATLLFAQFKSPLVWLLFGACVAASALGETVNSLAIGTILLVNALIGFLQEHRAERAVLALRSLVAPRARVLRDGQSAVLAASELVPDDVIVLEAGDLVPADALLFEANALLVNEAALTGESAVITKTTARSAPDAPLAEKYDQVFMGTAVANGTGRGVVSATGIQTQLGQVAHLLESIRDDISPLQLRLSKVSNTLIVLCLSIVVVVSGIGLIRGNSYLDMLLSAVSLAVAAVPEGLPAVVTIALAIGVQRMVSKHVLVRKLAAVETLGCATIICTDKTGTLTTGIMTVCELWGKDPKELVATACACCDAVIATGERPGIGDPTELALLTEGLKHGIALDELESRTPRITTNPFDSDRKRMSVWRNDGVLYVKGALETTLPVCTAGADGALEANEQMASRGLRVLAVAVGTKDAERDLRLVGLVGLMDPPRPEAIGAVAEAKAAGIRTIMITGDHPSTALAIGKQLGLLATDENPKGVIHARATPANKLEIVKSWKTRGEIVAMTGDGVNDAPALREANIGIAMGVTGTEVAREAADMILTDDNFASIVSAIQEGRGIFDNIRKTLVFLLAGNAAELAVMLGAVLIGLPLPLLPIHLLWINLVTDGLPALALVADPVTSDVMSKPPRRPDEAMLGPKQWTIVAWTAFLQATVTLSTFVWMLESRPLSHARSLAFSTLVFGELFRAFAARSADRLFWEVGAHTNLRLVLVVALSALAQLGLHHIPSAQTLFELAPLSLGEYAMSLGLGLIPVSAVELQKVLRRPRRRSAGAASA